jgi:predicted ester cyclase
MIASGDTVVTRAQLTGTHQGNFAGIAPTNKTVSWGGCNVTEFRDGKVVRSRVYADNASVFRQLGALSIPKVAAAG